MKALTTIAALAALVLAGFAFFRKPAVEFPKYSYVSLAEVNGVCAVNTKDDQIKARQNQEIVWVILNGCSKLQKVGIVFRDGDPLQEQPPHSIDVRPPGRGWALHVSSSAVHDRHYPYYFTLNDVRQTDPEIVIE